MLGGREAERAVCRPKKEKDVGLRNHVTRKCAKPQGRSPPLRQLEAGLHPPGGPEPLANWATIVQSPKAFLGRCLPLDLTQKRRKDNPSRSLRGCVNGGSLGRARAPRLPESDTRRLPTSAGRISCQRALFPGEAKRQAVSSPVIKTSLKR